MNIQSFLFKFSLTLYYVLRLMLIAFPISFVLAYAKKEGWKYGFTYIQGSVEMALFIAFAIAFLVGFYHALSFELVGKSPMENYLKSNQRVQVSGEIGINALKEKIESNYRVYHLSETEQKLSFRKRCKYMPADKVVITKKANGYEIISMPFSKLWFIDFGRNFKNVKEIAKLIKGYS